MAKVGASLVKELREATGAGMMDCKKALEETDGDIEAAIDWLRKEGLSSAAKKSTRAASEGLVGIKVVDNCGAIVEINSETDFVARNEEFQSFVESVTELSLEKQCTIEELVKLEIPGAGETIGETLTNMIATIGENMNLRRSKLLRVESGLVSSYMHNSLRQGQGKIGVLVSIESAGEKTVIGELGKQIAMHIAASNPLAISRDNLDDSFIEREKTILREQAKDTGKSPEIVEKMIEGRLRKFYEEVCLLEQNFVIDPDIKVNDAISSYAEKAGVEINISDFVRFELGEGLDKKEDNFAKEVAAAAET